jgi:hypothetical protein
MASILKIDELKGNTTVGDITITSEGGSATMQLQQGVCKSWCQWTNAGTPTASDSLNLSSIVDSATGRPDLNFTNNMSNSSYAASGFGRSGYSMMWDHSSTSQIGVIIWYGSYYDANQCSYMIQGDLA